MSVMITGSNNPHT